MEENNTTKLVMVQPNAVTNARYEYNQMQKDFMYYYIEKMNKYMTREKKPMSDLFGNIVTEMDLGEICKSNNYKPMLDAIKDLMKKPISYNYNRDDGSYDVTTTLVAAMTHKKHTGKILIKTTEESLPVLSYIGQGFTAFNKCIALSLSSYYAKRMYELCCRWKDKGFYRTTIKEFREMMMVEKKFSRITDLTINVLDLSARILSNEADLTFTYALRKENGSKSFNWLELNIMPTSGENGNKSGWYTTVYNILYNIYRDSTALHVCDFMADKDKLKKAAERLTRLQKDIDLGKIKIHGIHSYVNKVLINEFEVPEDLTTAKVEKQKKEKKEQAKILKATAVKAKKEKDAKAEMEKHKRSAKEIIQGMLSKNKKEETRTGGIRKIGDLFKK
jgi:plasmid replication initiation protein